MRADPELGFAIRSAKELFDVLRKNVADLESWDQRLKARLEEQKALIADFFVPTDSDME